jgi:hypothetical protein
MQGNAAAVELAQLGDLGNGRGPQGVKNKPFDIIGRHRLFDTDQFLAGNSDG